MPNSFGIDIDAGVDRLDELSRNALQFVYGQHHSIAETAEILRTTPGQASAAVMCGLRAVSGSLSPRHERFTFEFHCHNGHEMTEQTAQQIWINAHQ